MRENEAQTMTKKSVFKKDKNEPFLIAKRLLSILLYLTANHSAPLKRLKRKFN